MEKKIIDEKNENSLYSKITIEKQTPEDGFIDENKEHLATSWSEINNPPRQVYYKGYAKKISYTTNDPRITRPVAYAICSVFLVIGIILLLSHSWFFGISFTSMALFAFYKSKKDIDAIEENLKKQGHDMNSKEKKEEVRKEFIGTMKDGINDVTTSTFTKEHFNWFFKVSVPIYCIIVIVTSLFLTIAVHWILGLVVFGICSICGVFFYYIVSKICKN